MSWDKELEEYWEEEEEEDSPSPAFGQLEEAISFAEAVPSVPDESLTVLKAQSSLVALVNEDGSSRCCLCGQKAGIHRRTIYATIATWLVWLVCQYEDAPGWKHWSLAGSPLQRGGDIGKFVHWGLVESRGPNSGDWRPTEQGIAFAHGEIAVPDHCIVYNNQVLLWSNTNASISASLGRGFSFDETVLRKGWRSSAHS